MRQVNLLPEDIQKTERIKIIINSLLTTLVPVILGMALLHFLIVFRLHSLQRVVNQPYAQPELAQFQELRQEIGKIKSAAQGSFSRDRELIEYFVVNLPFSEILRNIGNIAQERVWLTGVTVDGQSNICEIEGRSFNTRLVSEFILNLKQYYFFQSVELLSMGEDKTGKEEETHFKIVCSLK